MLKESVIHVQVAHTDPLIDATVKLDFRLYITERNIGRDNRLEIDQVHCLTVALSHYLLHDCLI